MAAAIGDNIYHFFFTAFDSASAAKLERVLKQLKPTNYPKENLCNLCNVYYNHLISCFYYNILFPSPLYELYDEDFQRFFFSQLFHHIR
jgi:hypothetical protein